MPWDCESCQTKVERDDVLTCPSCGSQKTAWTMVADQTRTFAVTRSKKAEYLKGEGPDPCPQEEPPYPEVSCVTTKEALALPKAIARRLAKNEQLPAPEQVLFVRLKPPKKGGDLTVTLTPEYETREVSELEFPQQGEPELSEEGQYILSEPLNRACAGWKLKVLFPVDDRPSGTPSAQEQLEVLSPILNSLDRNTPLVLNAQNDDTAWCSAFVNWCMTQANQKRTNSAMAISWAKTWPDGTNRGKPAVTVQGERIADLSIWVHKTAHAQVAIGLWETIFATLRLCAFALRDIVKSDFASAERLWAARPPERIQPAYGSIVVFHKHMTKAVCEAKGCSHVGWWDDPPSWLSLHCCTTGHVGFVVGTKGSSIVVLGGNQGDGTHGGRGYTVNLSSYRTANVIGYMVPSGYQVPESAYDLPEFTSAQIQEGNFASTR